MVRRRLTFAPLAGLAIALAAASGCTRLADQVDASAPPPATASASASSPATVAASASPPAPAGAWAEAVRVGRWKDAAAAIDALDEASRSAPELRYVRARAALALGDHARAARLLDGLDRALPELSEDIAFHRAEAWIHAGPVEDAARYFGSRTNVDSLVKAACAWEKAGRAREARDAADRAVRAAARSTGPAAVEARSVRARIARAAGDRATAAADLKFVTRNDPGRAEAEGLDDEITRLDPNQAATASEHIDRAHRLARDGNSHAAMEAMQRAATAPGRPSPGALAFAKAMSLYLDRAHYAEAAEAFEQVPKLDRKLAPEAGYYAAKALARADQNPRAAVRYAQVARSFPRTKWGERAAYQSARLHMLEASWSDATRAYGSYLAAYPKGESLETARYELAVATLLAGKHERARKLLGELANRTREPLAKASLRHLEAVAALQSGDRAAALASWTANIRDLPLSWPALVAAARLAAAGHPAPPPLSAPPAAAPEPADFKLPPPAALLQRLGLDDEAEDWLREHEAEVSRTWGPRSGEAMCSLFGQLAPGYRRHQQSLRAVPAALLSAAPSPASRWAWECRYPRPYSRLVQELQSRDSLPSGLVYAIMRQESSFRPEARSPVGALGLMQLMPTTARKIAEETSTPYDPALLRNPADNLDLSARYLARLLRDLDGHLPLVVAAYNAGPKAVGRWLERAGELPLDLWVARIPFGETRRYVAHVMGNLARYRYMEQGEPGLPTIDLTLPKGIEVPADAY